MTPKRRTGGGRRREGVLLLYDLAWLPVALVRGAIEACAHLASARRTVAERLGWVGGSEAGHSAPTIWFHAVSVGELLSIAPVLERLRRARPAWRCAISVGNAAARRLAEERFRPRLAERVFLLPWDAGPFLRRAFRRIRPTALVIVECELWPHLMAQAARTRCPAMAINARIYARDFPRYRAAIRVFAPLLRRYCAIGAQSPAQAARYVALGADAASVYVGGSTKPDAAMENRPVSALAWRELVGEGPIWVLAATHPGEEDAILERAEVLYRTHPRLRLVIAPRHPERARRVVAICARAGRNAWTLADAEVRGPPEVLVIDRLGVLAGLVAAADLVFIGGTLVPRGGQTPLEAAAAGRAMLIGPSRAHFGRESAQFAAAGAWVDVRDADALVREASRLLGDPAARAELGRRAREVVAAQAGAADGYAARIIGLVDRVADAGGRA